MLVCEAPELVSWRPDFSTSGQHDPDSTKLVCGGVELCNTLEAPNWTELVVQVMVCEACGYVGCSSGGWVRVSRIGGHLLWTASDDEDARPPAYLRAHGAVAIPIERWEQWRHRIRGLPAAADFRPARRGDLRRAWGRPERFELLAAESETTEEAARHLRAVTEWLAVGEASVAAELVRAAATGTRIETLYLDVPDTFDRPQLQEWQAYAAVDGRLAPAFGSGWTIEPAPISALSGR